MIQVVPCPQSLAAIVLLGQADPDIEGIYDGAIREQRQPVRKLVRERLGHGGAINILGQGPPVDDSALVVQQQRQMATVVAELECSLQDVAASVGAASGFLEHDPRVRNKVFGKIGYIAQGAARALNLKAADTAARVANLVFQVVFQDGHHVGKLSGHPVLHLNQHAQQDAQKDHEVSNRNLENQPVHFGCSLLCRSVGHSACAAEHRRNA